MARPITGPVNYDVTIKPHAYKRWHERGGMEMTRSRLGKVVRYRLQEVLPAGVNLRGDRGARVVLPHHGMVAAVKPCESGGYVVVTFYRQDD